MSAPIFSTLGCRLNAYETEAMKELAEAAGLDNAVIVNTCAVTSEAVRKAKQEIRKLRRQNPEAALIVTGCAAQVEPATFAGRRCATGVSVPVRPTYGTMSSTTVSTCSGGNL